MCLPFTFKGWLYPYLALFSRSSFALCKVIRHPLHFLFLDDVLLSLPSIALLSSKIYTFL